MVRKLLAATFVSALLSIQSFAWAQNYPTRPVRVVVPAATGGPDIVARVVAAQLQAQLGQPFVIENRPGANGIVGADIVAKAPPDGYTLMVYSSGFVINPFVHKSLPYDTEKDFTPVTNLVSNGGLFLAVHPSVPAKTLQEFIAYARKPDAKLAYSTPGVGNTWHLAMEVFKSQTGTHLTHIPYKGGGPATAALAAGEVQAMLSSPAPIIPHYKSRRVRVLAYTGAHRHRPAAPVGAGGAHAGRGGAAAVPARGRRVRDVRARQYAHGHRRQAVPGSAHRDAEPGRAREARQPRGGAGGRSARRVQRIRQRPPPRLRRAGAPRWSHAGIARKRGPHAAGRHQRHQDRIPLRRERGRTLHHLRHRHRHRPHDVGRPGRGAGQGLPHAALRPGRPWRLPRHRGRLQHGTAGPRSRRAAERAQYPEDPSRRPGAGRRHRPGLCHRAAAAGPRAPAVLLPREDGAGVRRDVAEASRSSGERRRRSHRRADRAALVLRRIQGGEPQGAAGRAQHDPRHHHARLPRRHRGFPRPEPRGQARADQGADPLPLRRGRQDGRPASAHGGAREESAARAAPLGAKGRAYREHPESRGLQQGSRRLPQAADLASKMRLSFVLAGLLLAGSVMAHPYPVKPVRWIVPTGAGSAIQ